MYNEWLRCNSHAVDLSLQRYEIYLLDNPKYVFWYTKSEFGIPNLDLVYQIWIWYTKSGFGIPNLDLGQKLRAYEINKLRCLLNKMKSLPDTLDEKKNFNVLFCISRLMPLTSILPNLNLVYQIQIYTKSRFGKQNPDLVYQFQNWYTKSGFGIPTCLL